MASSYGYRTGIARMIYKSPPILSVMHFARYKIPVLHCTRCMSLQTVARSYHHVHVSSMPGVIPQYFRPRQGLNYASALVSVPSSRFFTSNSIPSTELISESLNVVSEPTLASLGLCHWTPPGAVQSMLELLHVSLDLPWWGSIVIATLCMRVVIFPIMIIVQRNSVKMVGHAPEMNRLQLKFFKAQMSGDVKKATRASLEFSKYLKDNKINPFKNVLPVLVQATVFSSAFLGLRGMTSMPVESMKTGGLLWFSDLTLSDPFYILPVIAMSTVYVMLKIGADGIDINSMNPILKTMMRVMPFTILPFMSYFPAAMLCFWCTSNACSLIQTSIFKIPSVRAYFKIEVIRPQTSAITTTAPQKNILEELKHAYLEVKKRIQSIQHEADQLMETRNESYKNKSTPKLPPSLRPKETVKVPPSPLSKGTVKVPPPSLSKEAVEKTRKKPFY